MYRAYTTHRAFGKHLLAIKTPNGGSIGHNTLEEAIAFALKFVDRQARISSSGYQIVVKRKDYLVYIANVIGDEIVKSVTL